jgi:hypothetical protein
MASLFSSKWEDNEHLYMLYVSFLGLFFDPDFSLLVLLQLSLISAWKLDVCIPIFSRYGCPNCNVEFLRITVLGLKLWLLHLGSGFIYTIGILSTSTLAHRNNFCFISTLCMLILTFIQSIPIFSLFCFGF